MSARVRFGRSVFFAGIAVGILGAQAAMAATTPPVPPRFFGFSTGLQYACGARENPQKAVAHLEETTGHGALPAGWTSPSNPKRTYLFEASLLQPPGTKKSYAISGQWTMSNINGGLIVSVEPASTNLAGTVTFRPGKWLVLSGDGFMIHVSKKAGIVASCNADWFFVGQRRNTPPSGPRGTAWILRGFFQHQATAVSGFPIRASEATEAATAPATPPLWVAVTPCAKQTTCLGAPGTNRADLLIRALPLSGGRQAPAYLALTTTGLDVWSRRVGETNVDARAWTIPAATADLDRPGFLDLLGYTPPNAATVLDTSWEQSEDLWDEAEELLAEFDPYLTNTVSEAGPPPPSGPWLTSSTLPGFRFKALLVGAPLLKANACPAQAICLAKTATGVPEIVARILSKQANGKRWPVVGKFASQAAQVWIEQIASHQVRYYELLARAADSPELPGIVDRAGFAP